LCGNAPTYLLINKKLNAKDKFHESYIMNQLPYVNLIYLDF